MFNSLVQCNVGVLHQTTENKVCVGEEDAPQTFWDDTVCNIGLTREQVRHGSRRVRESMHGPPHTATSAAHMCCPGFAAGTEEGWEVLATPSCLSVAITANAAQAESC
jgi:hypothetical protein